MVCLTDDVKSLRICLLVLTEYTNVTDTETDGQTQCDDIGHTYAQHCAGKTIFVLMFKTDNTFWVFYEVEHRKRFILFYLLLLVSVYVKLYIIMCALAVRYGSKDVALFVYFCIY